MGRSGILPYRRVQCRWAVLLLCGCLAVGLSGCGGSSFLGHQYTNFTAYYNKFHNAEAAFEKGIQSLEESTRPVDRTEYLSVFLEPQQSGGGGNSPFESAIQKSADVLREHPDSKWVDDALILIGKSYFYRNNYIGAAQKFREAIALETERRQEARFWLARTLVTNGQYSAADEVLRVVEGAGRDVPDNRWTAQLHLVRGELLVQQDQWDEAAAALERGLAGTLPDEPGARAAFLLGQVQETIGAPGQARTAYQRVQRYDPRYNLGLAARLGDIELQGSHGDAEDALDRLEDLESDDKNYEKRGEMALVRARIYRAQGRNDRARETIQGMLYGDEPPSGAAEGRLHYDLATLYRDAYKDFSRAAAHFDTASTGLQRGGTQGEAEPQRLPTAPVDATEQATRYRDLAERAREVARMDSLLRIGRMSDDEFQAFVAELRRKRQAAQEAQQEARREAAQAQQFQQRGQALGRQRRSGSSAADTRQSDAGFLFHQDPARVQQGRQQFRDTWGDRPRVDNWRRRNAINTSSGSQTASAPNQQQTSPSSQGGATAEGGGKGESGLDLSSIPRDSSSQAKMEAERAVARYELANSLFLAASRPDSAATWYRRILQQNGDHPVAKRALYALAEAYRAQGDTTAAQQAYLRLIDQHPDTRLAERARQRVDRSTADPTENRAALADTAYAHAYRRWQKGEWRPAIDSMLSIAERHPDTEAAPRALLASGIIYWRRTQVDSTAAPRTLVDRHLKALAERTLEASRQTTNETSGSRVLPDSAGSAQDSLTTSAVRDTTLQAEADSALTAQDSARAAPSRTARSDSLARPPPDTLRAAADTTQARDSTRTAPSRGGAPPDSVRTAAADSLQAAPDSVDASTDGMTAARSSGGDPDAAGKSDVYTPLKTLLDHLTEQYSDAPQAERARILLSMIEEKRAPAGETRADSAAVDSAEAVPDSTERARPPADSAALATAQPPSESPAPAPDSAREPTASAVPGDSAVARTDPADAPPEPDSAARPDSASTPDSLAPGDGPAKLDSAKTANRAPLPAPTAPGARSAPDNAENGRWTLLVETFEASQQASVRVAELGRQLGEEWTVDLIRDSGVRSEQYLLVVGQFSSEQAAARARSELQDRVSGSLEVHRRPQ